MTNLEFKPLYYSDKINLISHNSPRFIKEKLNIINPRGSAGIVTLWSNPEVFWNKLLKTYPRIFEEDSLLVTLTSLYGNGLPQMLANLANNPQIQYLAVTGNDTSVVPSATYLFNFLEQGIEKKEENQLGTIKGTTFPIDPQLNPNLFKNLKVKRFKSTDLEHLVNFIKQEASPSKEEDRIEIKLIEPEFSDFPSDITNHIINATTPLEAWMELIYRIDRFGQNITIKKGVRRTIFNLEVNIDNPEKEPDDLLRKFNFDPDQLREYRKDILIPELPEGTTYTYGNRLRSYFGFDSLDKVIERLKKDSQERRLFISLWDNKKDLILETDSDSSAPCLTDLYFINYNNRLMLTASFRTHNALSAWLLNLYGLRAIQEYVAEKVNIEPGKINVKSRWISIDPNDSKTASIIDLVKKNRKIGININDPRGYFIISTRDDKIIAEHYSPDANKLTTYIDTTAKGIKDKLRQNSVISDPDHAIWLGYELAKAHYELHKELPEL